jgi:hypothetical protein
LGIFFVFVILVVLTVSLGPYRTAKDRGSPELAFAQPSPLNSSARAQFLSDRESQYQELRRSLKEKDFVKAHSIAMRFRRHESLDYRNAQALCREATTIYALEFVNRLPENDFRGKIIGYRLLTFVNPDDPDYADALARFVRLNSESRSDP